MEPKSAVGLDKVQIIIRLEIMGKVTKVFNDTDVVIELKQGSANVFHLMHSLPAGKSYDIRVDESATYREYWCAVQLDSTTAERVVFSSDDCAEFSKVKIYKDNKDNNKYKWIGTELRGNWRNTPVPTKVPNEVQDGEASTRSLWQRITGHFQKKN